MATYTTLDAARTAYLANADYADDADLDKAKAFRSACRALLLLLPAESANEAHSGRWSPQLIKDELTAVDRFIGQREPSVADAVSRHMVVNFEDSRL